MFLEYGKTLRQWGIKENRAANKDNIWCSLNWTNESLSLHKLKNGIKS